MYTLRNSAIFALIELYFELAPGASKHSQSIELEMNILIKTECPRNFPRYLSRDNAIILFPEFNAYYNQILGYFSSKKIADNEVIQI